MDDNSERPPREMRSLSETYSRYRGDNIILDMYWLAQYSPSEIIDSVDDIVLGELGKIAIRNAARYAYGERCRRSSDTWDRLVPDELMHKLEVDLKRAYDDFQQAKLKRAQIERVESLTGRANVIPFPKRKRLPKIQIKKEHTA